MNTVEVLLILVGIPLAIILLLALLTLPGGRKRTRYKPGQPWDHAPVWYEPHPEHPVDDGHGETKAIGSSVYAEQPGERNTGRSMDGSTAHGATAAGAAAPRAVDAGPLGGARGTW